MAHSYRTRVGLGRNLSGSLGHDHVTHAHDIPRNRHPGLDIDLGHLPRHVVGVVGGVDLLT